MTLAVFTGIALLVVWAMVRKPEAIMAVLALAFVASVAAAQVRHGDELRPLLIGLDGMVSGAMAWLWTRHHSQRARIVGSISAANCVIGFWYMAVPYTVWQTYAAMLNAAFVVQVLVAGGFADGIADRLADRWRRAFPRSAISRRDVGA
jgi:hypothetical protein